MVFPVSNNTWDKNMHTIMVTWTQQIWFEMNKVELKKIQLDSVQPIMSELLSLLIITQFAIRRTSRISLRVNRGIVKTNYSPFLRNGDMSLSNSSLGTSLKLDIWLSFITLKEQCFAIFWMTSSLRLRSRKSDIRLRAAGRSWMKDTWTHVPQLMGHRWLALCFHKKNFL